MGEFIDDSAYLVRPGCDYKKGCLLVFAVHKSDGGSGYILEYNGIQRLIPGEKHSGYAKYHGIKRQYDIKGINAPFLGKIYGYKVSAAAGGIHHKEHTYDYTVDKSSENAYKQYILGNHIGGQHIGENTGEAYDQTGKHGELLSYIFESDIDRDRVNERLNMNEKINELGFTKCENQVYDVGIAVIRDLKSVSSPDGVQFADEIEDCFNAANRL